MPRAAAPRTLSDPFPFSARALGPSSEYPDMSSHRRNANASSVPASTPLSTAIGQALHARRARRPAAAAIVLAALALSAPAVQAQSTEWNNVGPAADWRDAANWTAGVPDADTDVAITQFVSDSYPLIDGGTALARDLFLGHASGLFIDNGASFTNRDSTVAGGVFVTRGSVWNARDVSVGTSNTTIPLPARVFVSTGAALNAQNIIVGGNSGDEGSLEVDAASASASGEIVVGDAGRGLLSLANGARVDTSSVTVGRQQGSNGSVQVGANSVLDVTGNIVVGESGTGEMRVDGQASVSSAGLWIGQGAGSSG
ncbi:MAG TPA: hypothetical protein VHF86_03660, partial [Xanthomonadaceae bacterium]|nr:hypothetical protein [Xanthomonadaceae bacterium]